MAQNCIWKVQCSNKQYVLCPNESVLTKYTMKDVYISSNIYLRISSDKSTAIHISTINIWNLWSIVATFTRRRNIELDWIIVLNSFINYVRNVYIMPSSALNQMIALHLHIYLNHLYFHQYLARVNRSRASLKLSG